MNDSNEEKDSIAFYCKQCDFHFKIKDGTPLDDIMCPKCETYEIFLEYDVEDDKVKL
ncbi:MAG: hypothetical protein HWN67_18655 [Candidatus Helarchaeota archaeon]|nr:hypothetical protein [Candidatus Helarchaeota archaeon]